MITRICDKNITQQFQTVNTNFNLTPQHGSLIVSHQTFIETTPINVGASVINERLGSLRKHKEGESEEMNIDSLENSILARLQNSLDLSVSQAEKFYYNCDYVQCNKLTEYVLKHDPYHSGCLPIHISCLVELKQSNKLFTLAHNLVDLYPNLAVSWFAVGCYYYVIGKYNKRDN